MWLQANTNLLEQGAGVGYPVSAFVEPHWGGAVEEGAPLVHGIAAVPGRWDEGKMRMVLEVPWWIYDVQLSLASVAPGPCLARFENRALLPQNEQHSHPLFPGIDLWSGSL